MGPAADAVQGPGAEGAQEQARVQRAEGRYDDIFINSAIVLPCFFLRNIFVTALLPTFILDKNYGVKVVLYSIIPSLNTYCTKKGPFVLNWNNLS